MSASEDRKRKAWCRKHRHNPGVRAWLKKNPPPRGWKGTKLEWAYTEMPVGLFTGRLGHYL